MVTHRTAGAAAWCGLLLIMTVWIKAEPWGICVRATPHKAEPGPEEKLYGEVQRPRLGWPSQRSGANAAQF